MFDAEREAYRCVATPQATVTTLVDLPPRLIHEFIGLDTEFGPGLGFAAKQPRTFVDLASFMGANPRGRWR